MAEYFEKKQDFEEAILKYHQAICSLLPNETDDSSIEDGYTHLNPILSELSFIKYGKKKGKLFYRKGDLINALFMFGQTIEVVNKLRQSYQSASSKLFLADQAAPIFEAAISTATELYRQTGD